MSCNSTPESKVQYEDIFSENIVKQMYIKLMNMIFDIHISVLWEINNNNTRTLMFYIQNCAMLITVHGKTGEIRTVRCLLGVGHL